MDKRDYTSEETEVIEETIPAVVTKKEEIPEPAKPMSQRSSSTKKPMTVKVVNCSRLAVREYPDPEARVSTIVNKDDILKVASDYQDETFSKILLKAGQVGYAMTKYLEVIK